MTIHLSKDLENAIHLAVLSGRFASADEMVAALVRDYARTHPESPSVPESDTPIRLAQGAMGAMQHAADELDEAMNRAARSPLREGLAKPEHDPILGLFHDDAELMDAIVAQAYHDRETDSRRDIPVE